MDLRSGMPFWLIKNGLPFQYPKLEESIRTDVVILGGGISGALAAHYLAAAGVDCVVVDARSIGLGSTCASTALLQYEIDVPLSRLAEKIGLQKALRAYQMGVESIDELEKITKALGFAEFEKKTSLYYAARKSDLPFVKKEFEIRKQNGFDVELLGEGDIKRDFCFNAPAAIYSQQAAQMDPYKLTHVILQDCIAKGVRVFDRTPIGTISHQRSGVTLQTGRGHMIKTKKLIYATGYEAVEFVDKKIVDLQSTYAIISDQSNIKTSFWKEDALMWNTANPYQYLRTTKDRRLMIGGRDEPYYNPGRRDKLLDAKRRKLVRDFHKLFPDVPFTPEFSWTGTFGSTKDGLPYIGEYEKLPNSYFALGFGGNGITFSVIAGQIVTGMILGKENRDASLYGFNRKT